MKKIFALPVSLIFTILAATSCSDSNTWDTYEEWRKDNNSYYEQQVSLKDLDGSDYYSLLSPSWYPTSGVLIHYFNDRSKTEGNLVPLVTSTVDVKYKDGCTTASRLTPRTPTLQTATAYSAVVQPKLSQGGRLHSPTWLSATAREL